MASSLLVPVTLLMNQMNLVDLEAVQSHAASLISGLASADTAVAVADKEKLLTKSQIHQKVIEMAASRDKTYKASWRKLVTKRNMVENVFGILEDCYSNLRTKSSNPHGWKAARALGGRQTAKWKDFKIRVIDHMYTTGSFNSSSSLQGLEDFEDTASGCDEIVWDAACGVLEFDSSPSVWE
jgi:hypothetical protein